MPPSIPPPVSPLATPGATVGGKYRLDSLVGYGGMGSVWAATHLGLGHQIAIKLIAQVHASTPEVRRRFDTEAKAVARLKSRHVVQVYDNGELADGTPYIAMELLHGESLHRRIHRTGPVQLPEAVQIVTGVCRALSKAHAAGIVHRDIKPDNIFLAQSEDDAGYVVKVLDFGVAKVTADAGEKQSSTQTGALVGTPLYMSPEQARGLKNLDHRTDLYSLGLVAHTMLTGNLPFSGESFGDLILKICTQPLPSLKTEAPWLPPAVDAWFQRAAAREAQDRYQSAQELSDAFAIAAGEQPMRPAFASAADASGNIQVFPPQGGPLGESVTQQYSRRSASSMASANTIAGATVKASRPPPGMMPLSDAPLPIKPRGTLVAALLAVAAIAGGGAWLGLRGRGHDAGADPGTAAAAAAASRAKLPAKVQAALTRGEKQARDGRQDLACVTYPAASDANPESGELALAALFCLRGDARTGRPYFRRAWEARASLSPRDAALLETFEPVFQREPSDLKEATKRLDAALARFPDDATLHYLLGSTLNLDSKEKPRARAELKRSLALDPNQPHTLDILAELSNYEGDFEAGRRGIEECLRVAPDALECLQEESWLEGELGACDKVEGAARHMMAIDPAYAPGPNALANALFAQGHSVESVREILRRGTSGGAPASATPSAAQRKQAALDEIHLAILAGDFVAAEARAKALAKDAGASTVLSDHAAPARLLVTIAEETGREKDADAIARDYLAGVDAWESNAGLDDWAMADEPTPLMIAVRRRAGGITRAAFDARTAQTVASWEKRVEQQTRSFIWIYAFAEPVETADDAKAAMEKLPSYAPVPPFKPLSLADAAIGRAYALAGRNDEARVALERATHNCFPIDHPVEHTRASYFLGVAREAGGDKPGACAAYRSVREAWGAAKPKSVTAQRAIARIAALRCTE